MEDINISFIIPVYNPSETDDYFLECIKSVEAIYHKGDEIIVIDDGSNNAEYIVSACSKYDNIKIIRFEENRGVSATRNTGINTCINNYYTIIDSDDYITDAEAFEKIRNQLCTSEETDMYIFGTTLKVKDELAHNIGIKNPKDIEDLKLNLLFSPFASYGSKLQSVGSAWAKIYRKNFTIQNNLLYEEIPHRAEDHVFFLDYLAANPRIKVIEEYAYFYRTNENSVTHQYNPNMYKMISNTVKSLEKRVDLNNPKECEAMLYRKVSYIATAINNVFHIDNKSSLYSKYKASRDILWSDDNLDALQSVDFSRYSFGKSGILLRMLRHDMILIPTILIEARRKAIISKRWSRASMEAIKEISSKHKATQQNMPLNYAEAIKA